MKKRIKVKKTRHKKIKFFIIITIFITSIYQTFIYLSKSNLKISNKEFVSLLLDESNYDNNVYKNIINSIEKEYTKEKLLNMGYYKVSKDKDVETVSHANDNLIYIYNTHQKEEYQPSNFVEEWISPTVMISSYIMKDIFDKNGFSSIVEERSISDLLKQNNWRYYKSYDASRIYMDDTKKSNPNLKYFIDVHRDSLPKEQTTIEINGKSYAKVIFLIGLENPNYEKNIAFTSKINDKLENKYPNISKGIYKKGGSTVNGVYNQDNSEYTILIEIGGYENTISEVMNTTLAFCEVFMEVIQTNEG